MTKIEIDGNRITFDAFGRPGHRHVIEFRQGFVSADRVGDDVVVSYGFPNDIRIERRKPNADFEWIVVTEVTPHVHVSADSRTLSVDGKSFALPGKLRLASVQSDGVDVLVYPDEVTGARNLYRYNLDGTLKWQVGERTFHPSIPYNGFSRRSPRLLNARGRTPDGAEHPKELGALIDYETGEVIAQQDPRYVM